MTKSLHSRGRGTHIIFELEHQTKKKHTVALVTHEDPPGVSSLRTRLRVHWSIFFLEIRYKDYGAYGHLVLFLEFLIYFIKGEVVIIELIF